MDIHSGRCLIHVWFVVAALIYLLSREAGGRDYDVAAWGGQNV